MFLKFPLWAWASCPTAGLLAPQLSSDTWTKWRNQFVKQIYMIRYDGCLIDVMDWSEVYELIYFKVGNTLFLSYFVWLRDC